MDRQVILLYGSWDGEFTNYFSGRCITKTISENSSRSEESFHLFQPIEDIISLKDVILGKLVVYFEESLEDVRKSEIIYNEPLL